MKFREYITEKKKTMQAEFEDYSWDVEMKGKNIVKVYKGKEHDEFSIGDKVKIRTYEGSGSKWKKGTIVEFYSIDDGRQDGAIGCTVDLDGGFQTGQTVHNNFLRKI